MNTKKKGDIVEKEALAILETDGFHCWIPPNAKFQTNDIFGIGDILCIKDNQVLLVAVALNRKQTNTVRKIEAARKFMGAAIHIQYYIKKKGEFVVYVY